jgi:restriction endonuclease Mrr
MAIRGITEENFYEYNVLKSPMASTLGTETSWYEERESNLLATVINDRFDNDWSYVILAKNENNEFTAIDLEVSIENQELVEQKVIKKLKELNDSGEYKEQLYLEKESIDKPVQSIIITDINEEVKNYFKKHPDKLFELNPRKFEELVASILEDMGLSVELTQATRDGGSDIIASIKNSLASFLILVECKRYAPDNKVDVTIVRSVAGVHMLKQPSKSIIVTTSTFTRDAKEEANKYKGLIELKDYENLKEWLKRY